MKKLFKMYMELPMSIVVGGAIVIWATLVSIVLTPAILVYVAAWGIVLIPFLGAIQYTEYRHDKIKKDYKAMIKELAEGMRSLD